MKTPLNCPRTSTSCHRLPVQLACVAALVMLGASACTCRHTVDVASSWQDYGVKVDYNLPVDYMSGKYRQLYRTDPHWFHHHAEREQDRAYYSK